MMLRSFVKSVHQNCREEYIHLAQKTCQEINFFLFFCFLSDFLASTDNTVSDDDLEHICWHVHSCRETVKPIVGSLPYSDTNSTKPPDNGHMSAPPRCDEILEDLQIIKRWKAMSAATTYRDKDDQFNDTVKFRRKSEEIGLKSKNTQSMPSNQMIQLCRALEKAAKKNRDGDGRVYHQLSKTFYKSKMILLITVRAPFGTYVHGQGILHCSPSDQVLNEYPICKERHCILISMCAPVDRRPVKMLPSEWRMCTVMYRVPIESSDRCNSNTSTNLDSSC